MHLRIRVYHAGGHNLSVGLGPRFVTGSAKAIRGGILDIRILYRCTIRPRAIRAYLENDVPKGLAIGTGKGLMSSWLNTDLLPTNRDVVYLDATGRFPFRNDQFD